MKYKNGREVKYGDVCLVYPIKKIWFIRKGTKTTKPYYVYIKNEHTYDKPPEIRDIYETKHGHPYTGDVELVAHIPDEQFSKKLDNGLLKRMEYVGNILIKPELFKLVFNQNIQ